MGVTDNASEESNALLAPRFLEPLGILTSPVTLGASGLGRGSEPGSSEEADAVATASAMLTGPFAVTDTSNNYAGGRSEAVLGLALQSVGLEEGRSIVTKVDADENGVFDGDRVRRSLEQSLERMGLDYVPLLHLHDPYTVSFEEVTGKGGALEALVQLRDEGIVGAIGVAAAPISLMTRYVDTGAFDAVLNHNRYTLVDQSAVPLYENARERGMVVFNAAPFGAGFLSGGSRGRDNYQYAPAPAELIAWRDGLEKVCARHGVPLTAVALHFSLRSPLIDTTVVGVSSPARIASVAELCATAVPDEIWAEIEALGAAPTPIDD